MWAVYTRRRAQKDLYPLVGGVRETVHCKAALAGAMREVRSMQCQKCNSGQIDERGRCSHCGSSESEETRTMHYAAAELPPGTVVGGKFRISGILGKGGMGVVYRAEDTKLHRTVALKFLPPEFGASGEARARFVMEARAAAALSHPHICTIFEIHDAEERPFLELEYVEGQSLRSKLREAPLGVNAAVELAIQIAEGLEEAHGKGIVHRDIKSANIMVTSRGQAKIMDFGLAKVRGETLYTREGTTLGTAAYMSPEQARGEAVDQRTDLWSLGVVLYEMVSGRLPFTGEREAPLLYAVVHEKAKPLAGAAAPAAVARIIGKALEKKLEARYASASEMVKDLRAYRDSARAEQSGLNLRALRKPKVAIPAAALLVLLVAAGGWWRYWQSKVRWAREVALPEAQRLQVSLESGIPNFPRAYALALQAQRYLPHDRHVLDLINQTSGYVTIKSDPPGADVSIREYSASENDWRRLGATPLETVRLPHGYYYWKFEKAGSESVMAVEPSFRFEGTRILAGEIMRTLDPAGQLPGGMVRVQAAKLAGLELADFFIDKYEVTNRQFNEFVNAGGYRERKYWKYEFVKRGKNLPWDQAVTEFVDQSGRPGPSTWSAGDYAKGQDDYPVSGVSWYEAAAYAEFAGKSLPSGYHWGAALGLSTPLFSRLSSTSWLIQLSNFRGEGPAAVGSSPSMSAYGTYDMGGNVREWCWNQTTGGRVVRGGAWNDVGYLTTNWSQADAFDRSPKNGFRCARYIDTAKIPPKVFDIYQPPPSPDYYKEKAAPDAVFQVYKAQFDYDKTPLDAKVESRGRSAGEWIHERVTFNAAYGGEKVAAYLFLPANAKPPFQTVIYFPGSGSQSHTSSANLERYYEFAAYLSFIVRNGRAAVYPIYSGTFERSSSPVAARAPLDSRQAMEQRIHQVQDFRRCIDYLETRPEFDRNKFAFLGVSWGGWMGPIIQSVEPRIKASILVVGGMRGTGRPEGNQIHFVPRARQPTLMLNGKYDMVFPYESTVKPLYDLLGTPPEHKRLRVYDTDHFVPHNEKVKETLAWLDRYLGPVK
jgi:dienelactone hydrolase